MPGKQGKRAPQSSLYLDPKPLKTYWNAEVTAGPLGSPTYLAITGNTGSGKSTVVADLAKNLRSQLLPVVGLNERSIHHPLLPLMFHKPKQYAFGIQLNFLIQRHLLVYRWLELGYIVIIERSHLDDYLFMQTHLELGNITEQEFAAYDVLFHALAARLPDPDMILFLDASPELSLERLKASEDIGERPREFPDEQTKETFVREWQTRFKRHYAELCRRKREGESLGRTILVAWPANTATATITADVISRVLGR